MRAERKAREQAEAERALRRRRLRMGLAAVAAAVAVVLAVVLIAGGAGDDGGLEPGEEPAGVAESRAMLDGIPQDGIALGDPDAPVTLVEFADLQCPFCRQYAVGALPGIVEDYVRPGRVRLELRLLRFIGVDSQRAAAVAAAAAAQDRLWNFTDLFYRNQGRENSGYVTDDFLRKIGEAAGLDVDRAFRDRDGVPAEELIMEGEDLANEHGIDSTPSFLVGPTGGRLERLEVTSLDAGSFREALDEALANAR